jgi:hypothetical protein
MGSAVVITIDLCPRRPALCAKCRAQSTYGSGQNCSRAIADPPVAPGSARSGSRNCHNARVPLYAIVGRIFPPYWETREALSS